MKNSTKGTLAVGAAVALLAGGAGSLAVWNADATVDGVRVATGDLKLTDADNCAAQPFKFADGTTYNPGPSGVTRIVPGDVLTKTCTFKITARGQNLSADLTTAGPTRSTNSALSVLTAEGSYTVDGASTSTITSAQNGKDLVAKITIALPASAGNGTQNTGITINGYTVTATQVAPAG